MFDPAIVVQTLRELGITRTEAEVYLATLQESQGGPVSGYRVAQSVGKDPANLSKTLASLEKLGAVRTIQEKPRLYLPIDPSEFTDKLIADMKGNRLRVLEQLEDLQTSVPAGVPLALNSREQAINKAAQILTKCRRECQIFGAREVLESLGTSLDALAASTEVSVKILSIEDMNWPGIEHRKIDLPVGFSDPQPIPWLQLIVDRQTWLTASFPSVSVEKSPCGWWSEDSSMALIMGASMAAALNETVQVSIEIPEVQSIPAEPIEEFEAGEIIVEKQAEISEDPLRKSDPIAQEEAKPAELEEADEDDDDEGIQFITRHDEE